MELCFVHKVLNPVVGVRVYDTGYHGMESSDKPGAPTPGIGHQIGRVSRESEELLSVPADNEISLCEGFEPRAEI